MTNFHLITHTDLDGAGCAVIMRRHFKVVIQYVDYQEIDSRLREVIQSQDFLDGKTYLWITDIYPSERVANEIHELFQTRKVMVQLLDHHETSSYMKKFPWAIHDTSACGTKLFYNHLENVLKISPTRGDKQSIQEFVEAVDAYDRWLLNHPQRPRGEDLNRLLNFYGREDFVEKFSGDLLLSEFDARKVLKYLRMKEERQIEDGMKPCAFFVDREGREFAVTLSAGKASETGHRLLERNPNLNYVVMPNPLYGKVELRSNGKVDVSQIAKKLGGGGHPNAAGFPLDSKKFLFDFVVKLISEGKGEENKLPVD